MKIPSLLTLLLAGFGLGWFAKPAPVVSTPALAQIDPAPFEIKSPGTPAIESRVGTLLFDRHHEKAVAVFDQLPGFGFSRIMPVIHHDFKNPAVPERTALFTEFDFTFIGNDATSRRHPAGKLPEVPAVFSSPRRGVSRAVPAEGADLVVLDAFEADPDSRRQFHIDGDSIVGYGPLRAAASCAKCHGVEEGTLLGMFRYRFDLPLGPGNRELAALLYP